MLLYKKSFHLKKGLRFSSYMKNLDKQAFRPFTLLVDATDDPKIYRLEILLNDLGFSSSNSFVFGGILLNHCTIQYDKEERKITITANMSNGNILLPLFYLSISFGFFIFIFFFTLSKNLPLENIFFGLIIMLMILCPYMIMYSNERKF